MKIILLREVARLGKPFDIVDVKDGYARNYLFPRKLALQATPANIQGLEKSKKRFSQRRERMREADQSLAERINNVTVKTTLKMGIDGKSFGSVTSSDISSLLQSEGIDIDKKDIVLEEPIRHPGVYDIKVHLHEQPNVMFKLVVLEEGS
jgi:large subunit ribosomal protein L9